MRPLGTYGRKKGQQQHRTEADSAPQRGGLQGSSRPSFCEAAGELKRVGLAPHLLELAVHQGHGGRTKTAGRQVQDQPSSPQHRLQAPSNQTHRPWSGCTQDPV